MTNIPGKDSNPQSRSHCITIIAVVVLCFLGAVPPLMISTIYTTTFLNSATFVSNDPVVCTRILKALRLTDLDEEDNERIRMSSVLQTGGKKRLFLHLKEIRLFGSDSLVMSMNRNYALYLRISEGLGFRSALNET